MPSRYSPIMGRYLEGQKEAIGRYAQGVKYVSIQTGVGRGGGYRPHAAAEVLAKNYGDCKDKANLMRAMLKMMKIEAYPVIIYSGDPTFVRKEWASPSQFNHCIIAIRVSPETKAATVIEHAKLGRLLIFDPTDGETPIGDLPYYLQGSLALVDVVLKLEHVSNAVLDEAFRVLVARLGSLDPGVNLGQQLVRQARFEVLMCAAGQDG